MMRTSEKTAVVYRKGRARRSVFLLAAMAVIVGIGGLMLAIQLLLDPPLRSFGVYSAVHSAAVRRSQPGAKDSAAFIGLRVDVLQSKIAIFTQDKLRYVSLPEDLIAERESVPKNQLMSPFEDKSVDVGHVARLSNVHPTPSSSRRSSRSELALPGYGSSSSASTLFLLRERLAAKKEVRRAETSTQHGLSTQHGSSSDASDFEPPGDNTGENTGEDFDALAVLGVRRTKVARKQAKALPTAATVSRGRVVHAL